MGGAITLGLRTLDGKVQWYETWTNSLTWLVFHPDFLTQKGEEWTNFKKGATRLQGPQHTEYGYVLLDTIKNVQYTDNNYSHYEEIRASRMSSAWILELECIYQHLLDGTGRDIEFHNYLDKKETLPFVRNASKFMSKTSCVKLKEYLDALLREEGLSFDTVRHKFRCGDMGETAVDEKVAAAMEKRHIQTICIGYRREYLHWYDMYSHPLMEMFHGASRPAPAPKRRRRAKISKEVIANIEAMGEEERERLHSQMLTRQKIRAVQVARVLGWDVACPSDVSEHDLLQPQLEEER
jgi:hypothetical protein